MLPKVWDIAIDAGPALGDGWAMFISGFYQQKFTCYYMKSPQILDLLSSINTLSTVSWVHVICGHATGARTTGWLELTSIF